MNSSDDSGSMWYYISEGQQRGPVTFEQLQLLVKSGKLDRLTSMALRQGMATWVPAHQVKGLFEDPPPPPLPLVSPMDTTTAAADAPEASKQFSHRCDSISTSDGVWHVPQMQLGEKSEALDMNAQGASAKPVRDGEHSHRWSRDALISAAVIGAVFGAVLLIAVIRRSIHYKDDVPRYAKQYAPKSPQPTLRNSIELELVLIPPGSFKIGEWEWFTGHRVTLTKSFYLGMYEVTQSQYEKVMRTNPSRFRHPSNPVENVSWKDAVEFCKRLSELPAEKAAGHVYRLPTEAEWEYACRAGTTTKYSFGDDSYHLREYAWYSQFRTHPVGQKKPNPWGLYDMHGNVWEWCADWWGDYQQGPVTDPSGPDIGQFRVLRGGAFNDYATAVDSADRKYDQPYTRSDTSGFRVARTYP